MPIIRQYNKFGRKIKRKYRGVEVETVNILKNLKIL
jgi:hypothetical protein